ncbi:uncharacterized protein N7459_006789 [Penicillium hispanicum]|uniref:uncharacterized protein n=1 Tax=Penicillium hispanicum TaxID=1080232 RepID=UPI0025404FBF|nr:uncharacterized protein N7459_006789 [Penicillium hispanicum]KAJ5577825.1 hypothetical protein N7459_006789 [Penicillium hispanicum]
MLLRQVARPFGRSSGVHLPVQKAVSRRLLSSTSATLNSSQNPSSYRQGINAYRTFAGPFGKVFLGAVFTYQVIYWTWVKLETDEDKLERNKEAATLEKKARELAAAQK